MVSSTRLAVKIGALIIALVLFMVFLLLYWDVI